MINVVDKAIRAARDAGVEDNFMVCERGTSFGYNNLVSDMRSLEIMKRTNCPVIFDASLRSAAWGRGSSSGGQRVYLFLLRQRLPLVSQVFLWRHILILTKLFQMVPTHSACHGRKPSRGTL